MSQLSSCHLVDRMTGSYLVTLAAGAAARGSRERHRLQNIAATATAASIIAAAAAAVAGSAPEDEPYEFDVFLTMITAVVGPCTLKSIETCLTC